MGKKVSPWVFSPQGLEVEIGNKQVKRKQNLNRRKMEEGKEGRKEGREGREGRKEGKRKGKLKSKEYWNKRKRGRKN